MPPKQDKKIESASNLSQQLETKDAKNLAPLEDTRHIYYVCKPSAPDPVNDSYHPKKIVAPSEQSSHEAMILKKLNNIFLPGIEWDWKIIIAKDESRQARLNIRRDKDALYKARQIVEAINLVVEPVIIASNSDSKSDATISSPSIKEAKLAVYIMLAPKDSYAVIIPSINSYSKYVIKNICKAIQNSWIHGSANRDILEVNFDAKYEWSEKQIAQYLSKTSDKDQGELKRLQNGQLRSEKKQKKIREGKDKVDDWSSEMQINSVVTRSSLDECFVPRRSKEYFDTLIMKSSRYIPFMRYCDAINNPWLSDSRRKRLKDLLSDFEGATPESIVILDSGFSYQFVIRLFVRFISKIQGDYSGDAFYKMGGIVSFDNKHFVCLLIHPKLLTRIFLLPCFNMLFLNEQIIFGDSRLLVRLPPVATMVKAANEMRLRIDNATNAFLEKCSTGIFPYLLYNDQRAINALELDTFISNFSQKAKKIVTTIFNEISKYSLHKEKLLDPLETEKVISQDEYCQKEERDIKIICMPISGDQNAGDARSIPHVSFSSYARTLVGVSLEPKSNDHKNKLIWNVNNSMNTKEVYQALSKSKAQTEISILINERNNTLWKKSWIGTLKEYQPESERGVLKVYYSG